MSKKRARNSINNKKLTHFINVLHKLRNVTGSYGTVLFHIGSFIHRKIDHSSFSQPTTIKVNEADEEEKVFICKEAFPKTPAHPSQGDSFTVKETQGSLNSIEDIIPPGNSHLTDDCRYESPSQVDTKSDTCEDNDNKIAKKETPLNLSKNRHGQSSNLSFKRWSRKNNERPLVTEAADKSRGSTIVSRLNSRMERVEAWR